MQREPARRRKRGGAFIDKPALDQRIGDEPLQIRAGARLHARRDFFGQKFKQEGRALRGLVEHFAETRKSSATRASRLAPVTIAVGVAIAGGNSLPQRTLPGQRIPRTGNML